MIYDPELTFYANACEMRMQGINEFDLARELEAAFMDGWDAARARSFTGHEIPEVPSDMEAR